MKKRKSRTAVRTAAHSTSPAYPKSKIRKIDHHTAASCQPKLHPSIYRCLLLLPFSLVDNRKFGSENCVQTRLGPPPGDLYYYYFVCPPTNPDERMHPEKVPTISVRDEHPTEHSSNNLLHEVYKKNTIPYTPSTCSLNGQAPPLRRFRRPIDQKSAFHRSGLVKAVITILL